MTQEEKKAVNAWAVKKIERQVMIDLSARLPYRVKMQVDYHDGDKPFIGALRRIDYGSANTLVVDTHVEVVNESGCALYLINHTKPYLRSMSSMTEEERREYNKIKCLICPDDAFNYAEFDWLMAHHYDVRNLIERGLAIEAPVGMYNF